MKDDVWAIVELMGHVKLAGRLTEEEKFGAKMGRLDIPTTEPCTCANGSSLLKMPTVPCDKCDGSGLVKGFVTQMFGGGSVYRITIVTEDVARHVNRSTSPAPVSPWDFPKRLESPAAAKPGDFDYDDFEQEYDK